MKPTILITGASGFVGSHLLDYLLTLDRYDIHGTVYGTSVDLDKTVTEKVTLHEVNLLDANATEALILRIKPAYVIHLAALSSASVSFKQPGKTITDNTLLQLHLFDALIKLDTLPVTIITGSAEEYGIVEADETPVNESNPFRPISPYAVSKITQDFLGYQYFLTYKLPVIRLRPFNHTGERRPPTFVLPAFAKQVAEIEAGIRDSVMVVGDLSVTRDFTDVKDMVKAYELALHACNPGEAYNIGSGRGIVIEELLNLLLKQTDSSIKVKRDPSRFRPADVKTLVCDATKFTQATGWQPTIALEDTVKRVLDYWRGEVKKT